MGGKVDNYAFGADGVNLVKNPLELLDSEATQLQNFELMPDQAKGGKPTLSKRGGIQVLTSGLDGDVTGMIGLPLNTTYVRTLYVSRRTATSDTWYTSTDGTTFSLSSSALAAVDTAKNLATASYPQPYSGRIVGFRNKLIYPGDDYTRDFGTPTNGTAPPINLWNGTNAIELLELLPGPSSDGSAVHNIADMLVADGYVYISTFEPTSTTPNLRGRVLRLNLSTGQVEQIANAFGPGTNDTSGGAPGALCWFQGRLWVGLQNGVGTGGIGKVVWAYPGVSTSWTTDTAALSGPVYSLAEYKGQLYAGLDSTTGGGGSSARVMVRSNSAGTWSASKTDPGNSSNGRFSNLIVFNSELYAHLFSDAGTDDSDIWKFDGTTWTKDRDLIDSGDLSSGSARYPLNAIEFNSALYFAFPATGASATDGFVLKRTAGGTWSLPVSSANINGHLGILVQRS